MYGSLLISFIEECGKSSVFHNFRTALLARYFTLFAAKFVR